MLALRVVGIWLWLVIGSAVPTMLVGLLTGQGVSSEHLIDHYAGHLPQALVLLALLIALAPVGDYLTRRDLEAMSQN